MHAEEMRACVTHVFLVCVWGGGLGGFWLRVSVWENLKLDIDGKKEKEEAFVNHYQWGDPSAPQDFHFLYVAKSTNMDMIGSWYFKDNSHFHEVLLYFKTS